MEKETEAGRRLNRLSELAGFESIADFARAVNIEPVTARLQLHRNSITKGAGAKYVKKAVQKGVSVDLEWVLTGDGPEPKKLSGANVRRAPTRQLPDHPPPIAKTTNDDMIIVPEHDVRAPSGPNHSLVEISLDDLESVVAHHGFPREGFRQVYGTAPENVRIAKVVGDSMIPTLFPGQPVMVDISDRNPSPGGIFYLWDGGGLVLKRLERVIGSKDPPKVAIISDNPHHRTYEVPLEDVHINGRVIGVWSRR